MTRATLQVGGGVLVWGAHFALVYGGTALACARGRPDIVPALVIVATVVAGAGCAALVVRDHARRERFEAGLASSLAGLALVAIVWEAVAALLAPACR